MCEKDQNGKSNQSCNKHLETLYFFPSIIKNYNLMKILPEAENFIESNTSQSNANSRSNLVWTCMSADLETPVSVFLKLKDEKYCGLFESVEDGKNRSRYSFIACDPDLLWSCNDSSVTITNLISGDVETTKTDDVFASFRQIFNQSQLIDIPKNLPPMSSGLFGYMGYDMVKYMENIPNDNPKNIDIPESIFMRPQIVIIFDSVKDEMIITTPIFGNIEGKEAAKDEYEKASNRIRQVVEKIEGNISQDQKSSNATGDHQIGEVKSNTTREEFYDMVEKAKEYILAGDIFQVVLAQRFEVDFPSDASKLYRKLRRLNPSPYSFCLRMGDLSLVGSSPEILVKVEERKVTIRPIAGTSPRGTDAKEDDQLAKKLLSDKKELAEHLMLIDLGRNDVGRVSKVGSVNLTDKMIIEYYSHVMHIVSNVEGDLREDLDAVDALISSFPVGTVSGAPKIRSMEIIDELEKQKRSFYAGGVGYFSANGDVDTCIALRTGLVKDDKLYIQAGGGVVADSSPEGEYQESHNKAKALITAARNVFESE